MGMNDVEIKINGKNVDIDPEDTIAGTFQTNDIGDLTKIKSDVTSTIDMLDTPKNHKIMEHAAKLGSDSAVQLGEVSASVLFRGIPLMSNGRAMIKGVKGGYKLNILGGNFDFIDKIRDKKLSDLDWSSYDYTASASHFKANYFSTSGICFPVVEYTKDFNWLDGLGRLGNINIHELSPWIFLHTVVSEIITQAGFKLSGSLFSLDDYTSTLLSLKPPKGTSVFNEAAEVSVILSDWVPDMLQIDIIKTILFKYGSFISAIENTLYFIRFDDLYKNQGVSKDWSDKYDDMQDPNIIFETGYAQTNLFKYKEISEPQPTRNLLPNVPVHCDVLASDVDGEIVSDNKNLAFEKTIIELPFEPTRMARGDQGGNKEIWLPWMQGLVPIDPIVSPGVEKQWEPEWEARLLTLYRLNQKDSIGNTRNFSFTILDGSLSVIVFNSSEIRTGYFPLCEIGRGTVVLSDTDLGLTWDKLHLKYWHPIENSMLKNPTKVIAKFNLSVKDIRDLKEILADGKHGGAVPVYVKQLNGHYFVNKISRFIPDRLTQVELIRL